MPPPASACYTALRSRDRRFDGVFFTGVRTTGIYCRPVCPTRAPKAENCVFFDEPTAAAAAGFRPCLRCRPELSPARARSADEPLPAQLLRFLRERALLGQGVSAIARAAGYSERQFRRLLVEAYGVGPTEVVQNERLLFAKRLLHDTRLSLSAVALASGFRSVRRFNATFRERLRLTPGQVRGDRNRPDGRRADRESPSPIVLTLNYRPPFAWREMLGWLGARVTRGVDWVFPDGRYGRTCCVGGHAGWMIARNDAVRGQVVIELAPSLSPVIAGIQTRWRQLLDLDAHWGAVSESLGLDPFLAPLLARHPGLRVPGAFDVFETAVRIVLGQQVTVAAATTLAGRVAQRFGRPTTTPFPELNRFSITPETLRRVEPTALCELGVIRRRAETLRNLAEFAVNGGLDFPPGTAFSSVRERLMALPGVGAWTAEYIALRALRFPDAFPAADLGLRQALARDPGDRPSSMAVAQRAEAWRPWRAYAAALLWQSLIPATPRAISYE